MEENLIKMSSELESDSPIITLIYGQPGVGKTVLAIGSDRPLLLDFDHGILRVQKEFRYKTPTVQVRNYDEVLKIINEYDLSPYKTIVIDTLGKLVKVVGDWAVKRNPKNMKADGSSYSWQGWGAIKNCICDLVQNIASKGKHVILVAHESEEKDGEERYIRPDVQGSARKDIIKELDLMGYMQMFNNRRTICFTPTDKFYAKNSAGLKGFMEIPEGSKTFFKDNIIDVIIKQREEDKRVYMEYEELINRQAESINHISTIDDLNIAYKALSEQEPIWDSEISWKRKLKDRADLLKATFNKVTGAFENANNTESV